MKGKTLLVAFTLYFVSYILIVNLNHIWKYSQENVFSRYNLDTLRDVKIKKFYKEVNRLLHLKESTPVEDEKLSDIEGRFYDSLSFYFTSTFISGGSRIFPREVRPFLKMLLFFNFFAENCMKMTEFGSRRGGARPWRPLRSANVYHCWLVETRPS